MIMELYVGNVITSVAIGSLGVTLLKCKLKHDGYESAKLKFSDNLKYIAKNTLLMIVPGVNIVTAILPYTATYNNVLYRGYKEDLINDGIIVPIENDVKVKKLK